MSFTLSLFFIVFFFFGYTLEFTFSSYFLCLLGFWWFIYVKFLVFCIVLTHLEQKFKKKNLNKTHDAKLESNLKSNWIFYQL